MSAPVSSKKGKFCGSQRPSAMTQSVMLVVAPVPTPTIRSGRTGDAPAVVTRTGRIAVTPSPGASFIARKLKPPVTYADTTEASAAGIA